MIPAHRWRGMMGSMAVDERETVKRVPIGFPPDLYEWLRQAAFSQHTRMAEIVREALREYRDRHDPQLPLPMRRGGER